MYQYAFQVPGRRYAYPPAVFAPEGDVQDTAAVFLFFRHTPHSCPKKSDAEAWVRQAGRQL